MSQPPDASPDDELSMSEQITIVGSAMETLETQIGVGVDPAVDLGQAVGSDGVTGLRGPPPSAKGDVDATSTGRYAVRGEIARGGMGAILNVRDKDLRRSLAMKVILGGSSERRGTREPVSRELLHRFLEEAQVTAQLVHPGIVPVHELGVDELGRVYFTMSLVHGETLGEVIAKTRAGQDGWTKTRALQVILRVCETMAFAHDKGVIHRDLKPANIMVGGYGVTYVMDWGLAKVVGRANAHDIRLKDADTDPLSRIESNRSAAGGDDSPIMTMDGAVVGTPAYMPPEQAEGRIDEVDERSDVYALGALLYQLLTGEAPYVKSGARMTPHAVLTAVTTGPPPPVNTIDPTAPEELQAICEKAMAQDRNARYGSAAGMAEDLQRFLSGHVVRAHKTGALVEMRKWVVRNKSVAATAAMACVVVAALTAFFLVSLSDERDRADARATEAEQERARAEVLANFMLFDLRDRLEPIGRLDLLGEVAAKSLDYYQTVPDDRLSDDRRRGRGAALSNVGDVLLTQGDATAALTSFRAALETREHLAAQDPTNTEWLSDLSDSHDQIGDVLLTQGDAPAALESFRAALEIREPLAAQDPTNTQWQRDLSDSHARIGDVLLTQGDAPTALESVRFAHEISERLAAQDPTNTEWQSHLSASHRQIGDVLLSQGDAPTALESFRAALEIAEHLAAQDPTNAEWQRGLSVGHDKIGDALLEQEDASGALTSYSAALELAERLAAQDPTNTEWQRDLSVSHDKLGDVLRSQGDDSGALASYSAALELAERLAAQDPTNTEWQRDLSVSHDKLGDVLRSQGDDSGALASYSAALELAERLAAQDPTNTEWQRDLSVSHDKLGDVLRSQGDDSGALASYSAALEIAEQLAAQDPTNSEWQLGLFATHAQIGGVLLSRGDASAALESLRAALELAERLAAQDPTNTGRQSNLSSIRRTVRRIEIRTGDRIPESAADQAELGHAHYASSDYAKSVQAFELAFQDADVRCDLDRLNLYDAACSAALAAQAGGAGAAAYRTKAIAWLAEDLERHRALLDKIDKQLADGEGAGDEIHAARADILEHFELARVGDSDLDVIRGTPEFEALFEGLPTEE